MSEDSTPPEPARPRSVAREAALKALYQLDLREDLQPEALFVEIADEVDGKDARRFARDLVNGVRDQRAAIDAELSAVAINWRVERMATIDRNILRIGAYELLFRDDVPPVVSINEAVTLAKKYSSKESGGFVNGILDKIRVRAESGATVSAPADASEGEAE